VTFLPAPGPLGAIELPSGAFVRSDSAFTGPGEVSLNYDPMISKISVWAPTRAQAVDRMRAALDEARVEPPKRADGTRVGSLRTNLSFLRRLVRNGMVIAGDTTTDLIARNPSLTEAPPAEPSMEAALALATYQLLHETEGAAGVDRGAQASAWQLAARREGARS
jgi:acetyl-CoA/propionyl-CoA carboxylase biotin carboxyl carrier protein